ncbi:MAG: dipeptidase [Bacteroidota bacterium]
MKKLLLIILLPLAVSTKAQLLVDTHNDAISNELITGHDLGRLQTEGNFDLVRAKQGGLNAQIFSIWCSGTYGKGTANAMANREIDSLFALIKRYPDKIALVTTPKQLKATVKNGKLAALIGVEGGHMIEDSIAYLDQLAKRGMSYMTLTWNNSTSWATSAAAETAKPDTLKHKGLTDFGKQIVHHMNELGVMVDVSHVGEQTFYDVIATTSKPVIASHSCVWNLDKNRRNLKDEQLQAIAKNDGVVFINFYSGFVDSTYNEKENAFVRAHRSELDSLIKIYHDGDLAVERLSAIHKEESNQVRPPLSMLIKHFDYIAKLIGVDHVGIGSDFDGSESFPQEMDSVADYPKIKAELLKIGYSKKDVAKIFGGNFMRVFKANKG